MDAGRPRSLRDFRNRRRMLKVRPLLVPFARLLQQGRGVVAAADFSAHRHLQGKCRQFSGTNSLRFAACEDEIHASVGKVQNAAGNDRRAQKSTSQEVDEECEDEIFASVGEFLFTWYDFGVCI